MLKGQGTIVSDGRRNWTCTAGSPVLATAGTGDVLSGIIGGLLAQDHDDAPCSGMDLVALGVWIHAAAGEAWSEHRGSAGMLASELAGEIPAILQRLPRGD